MAGTPIYSSINAHLATGGKITCLQLTTTIPLNIEYFKKDDLESMMYVLV